MNQAPTCKQEASFSSELFSSCWLLPFNQTGSPRVESDRSFVLPKIDSYSTIERREKLHCLATTHLQFTAIPQKRVEIKMFFWVQNTGRCAKDRAPQVALLLEVPLETVTCKCSSQFYCCCFGDSCFRGRNETISSLGKCVFFGSMPMSNPVLLPSVFQHVFKNMKVFLNKKSIILVNLVRISFC